MTDEMMNFRTLAEKATDADIPRDTIAFGAERPMDMEVGDQNPRDPSATLDCLRIQSRGAATRPA